MLTTFVVKYFFCIYFKLISSIYNIYVKIKSKKHIFIISFIQDNINNNMMTHDINFINTINTFYS